MPHLDFRRTLSPWRLGGLTPWALLVRSLQGFRLHHLDARAAQFAYYSMLLIAPVLIVLIATLAQFPLEGVLENLTEATGRTLPEGAHQVVVGQIREIQAHSNVSLIALALLVLIFAGSNLFLTISRALNSAYGVKERRRIWTLRGLALLVTLGSFLMLLTALMLLVVGPVLSRWVEDMSHLPMLGLFLNRGVRWAVGCTAVLLSTSLVYWLAPCIRSSWSPLSPGSVFATIGWVSISVGFQFFVERFGRYNETYGTLAGVIMLMVWLYLTGAVLLMGGQIDSAILKAERESK